LCLDQVLDRFDPRAEVRVGLEEGLVISLERAEPPA